MPDNKSISQLTTAEQTTSSDLFETSIPNGSLGYLSRKVSLDAIANFIANNLNYSDLQTVAKTLIGAINEAAQSGGGASIQEMTQAEYNALTPEQKADGTLRAISDATTSISNIDDVNISSVADGDVLAYDSTSSKWVNKELEADAIAYDNTSSGLNATDVQAAIDEVNTRLTGLIKTRSVYITTNSAGQYVSNLNFSDYAVLQVYVSGVAYFITVREAQTGKMVFNCFNAADLSPVASETFTATMKYI